MTILLGVKWYLVVVLVCVSLMAQDDKALSMCLLTSCVSWREIPLQFLHPFFAHWVVCLFVVELWELFIYCEWASPVAQW